MGKPATGLLNSSEAAFDPKETLAESTMISPKAVCLGVLTVVVVGLLFALVSSSFEFFLVRWLTESGNSFANILDKMYWPTTAFIWSGIFAAFGLGSYVATRLSRSEYALDSSVVLIVLLTVVWATKLYSGAQNLLGVVVYSIIATLAVTVGTKLARRKQITDSP